MVQQPHNSRAIARIPPEIWIETFERFQFDLDHTFEPQLQHDFSWVDSESKRNSQVAICSSVCRVWKDAAESILNNHLLLRRERRARMLVDKAARNPDSVKHCRSLTVSLETDDCLTSSTLGDLLESLSSDLKKLVIISRITCWVDSYDAVLTDKFSSGSLTDFYYFSTDFSNGYYPQFQRLVPWLPTSLPHLTRLSVAKRQLPLLDKSSAFRPLPRFRLSTLELKGVYAGTEDLEWLFSGSWDTMKDLVLEDVRVRRDTNPPRRSVLLPPTRRRMARRVETLSGLDKLLGRFTVLDSLTLQPAIWDPDDHTLHFRALWPFLARRCSTITKLVIRSHEACPEMFVVDRRWKEEGSQAEAAEEEAYQRRRAGLDAQTLAELDAHDPYIQIGLPELATAVGGWPRWGMLRELVFEPTKIGEAARIIGGGFWSALEKILLSVENSDVLGVQMLTTLRYCSTLGPPTTAAACLCQMQGIRIVELDEGVDV